MASAEPHAAIAEEVCREGFTFVYRHPQAKADIVLVHGVNGHPKRTWTGKEYSGEEVFWPTDLLPSRLDERTRANIITFGFNADVGHADWTHDKDFIHKHAEGLVKQLSNWRHTHGSANKPIIWIAHGLGGTLIKQAMIYSNDPTKTVKDNRGVNWYAHFRDCDRMRSVFLCTHGIVFLDTPHDCTSTEWRRTLKRMAGPSLTVLYQPLLLKTLKREIDQLQYIDSRFEDISTRIRKEAIYIRHITQGLLGDDLVVRGAANRSHPNGASLRWISDTHEGICKFVGTGEEGFIAILGRIREWVVDGSRVVAIRLVADAQIKHVRHAMEEEIRFIQERRDEEELQLLQGGAESPPMYEGRSRREESPPPAYPG